MLQDLSEFSGLRRCNRCNEGFLKGHSEYKERPSRRIGLMFHIEAQTIKAEIGINQDRMETKIGATQREF
jgi:hypothetical protein